MGGGQRLSRMWHSPRSTDPNTLNCSKTPAISLQQYIACQRLPNALKPTVTISFPGGSTATKPGDPVKVEVATPYKLRAIMKLGTITLAARTTMRLEQEAKRYAAGPLRRRRVHESSLEPTASRSRPGSRAVRAARSDGARVRLVSSSASATGMSTRRTSRRRPMQAPSPVALRSSSPVSPALTRSIRESRRPLEPMRGRLR